MSVDLRECVVAYVQPIIIIHKIKRLNIIVKLVIVHVSNVLVHQQVIAPNAIKIKLAINISFLSVDLRECVVVYVQPIIIIQKIKRLNIIVKLVIVHVSNVLVHQQVIAPNAIKIKLAINISFL